MKFCRHILLWLSGLLFVMVGCTPDESMDEELLTDIYGKWNKYQIEVSFDGELESVYVEDNMSYYDYAQNLSKTLLFEEGSVELHDEVLKWDGHSCRVVKCTEDELVLSIDPEVCEKQYYEDEVKSCGSYKGYTLYQPVEEVLSFTYLYKKDNQFYYCYKPIYAEHFPVEYADSFRFYYRRVKKI